MLALPYHVQNQRVLVVAKFRIVFHNPRANSAPFASRSIRTSELPCYIGPALPSVRNAVLWFWKLAALGVCTKDIKKILKMRMESCPSIPFELHRDEKQTYNI